MRLAPWRVVEARPSTLCTETTTMLILGIILSVFAIGFFCWLLFTLAVYALPFFVGMTAGFAAYHAGYGVFAAALIAIIAGGATLGIGQVAFALVRAPLLRAAIALVFAVPAAIAGYHATLGIAHICIAPGAVSQILAAIGAAMVGGTAWSRMALFLSPTIGQDASGHPVQPHLSPTANG
jgi:hypothetical protein